MKVVSFNDFLYLFFGLLSFNLSLTVCGLIKSVNVHINVLKLQQKEEKKEILVK